VARALSFGLDQISLGETESRRPAYQVLAYDLRTGGNTVKDVVIENVLAAETGPMDVTAWVTQVQFQEQAGAYVTGGIAATQVTVTIVDPDGRFDPLASVADPTIPGRFFRTGNLVRIVEGDNQVDSGDWPLTFTGVLIGQSGYARNETATESVLQVRATSREATFLNLKRTTNEFLIGTSYFTVATTIATEEMGLDLDEIDFPTFGSALIPHKSIQFAQEDPMTMLSRIGLLDALLPKFTGEGKLTMTPDRATGSPSRVYTGRRHILSLKRPVADVQVPSSVCVVGLASALSKTVMPRQVLSTLEITTGYFTQPEDVKVYWRDDKSLLAENVRLKVLVSVNGGIIAIGGGESITLLQSADPEQLGTIGIRLEADSGYAPWLIVFFLVGYVVFQAIPDAWAGFGAGFTTPIGRIVSALSLATAMIIMSKLGRGSYVFEGDPFEYVYAEIRRCAKIDGTPEFEENELVLENHLVATTVQADQIAFQQLNRIHATAAPRAFSMIHDLGMEPGDIFEFLDTGERYLCNTITRTLTRNADRTLATVSAFEVTSTVSLGT
jgi:hypothetical protein